WDHRDSFVDQLVVDWVRQKMTRCSSNLIHNFALHPVCENYKWESLDDSDGHGKEQPCHVSRYF
ncbi:MAG: hypothetical protein KC592_06400, partial [Nitrospira sp.]|nr:hypothetical protein [Nitrospira sp.]